jgi:hypothetical protein
MVARISFFVVGNGDMTLIELESGRKILIDINIRGAADDPDDDTPDVAKELRDRLTRDVQGRLYVDAFLLSHPDQDHCRRLQNHFHLGPPTEWSKDDDQGIRSRALVFADGFPARVKPACALRRREGVQ